MLKESNATKTNNNYTMVKNKKRFTFYNGTLNMQAEKENEEEEYSKQDILDKQEK